jgi:hypothetical protein
LGIQRWYERLPKGVRHEPNRLKIVKALERALATSAMQPPPKGRLKRHNALERGIGYRWLRCRTTALGRTTADEDGTIGSPWRYDAARERPLSFSGTFSIHARTLRRNRRFGPTIPFQGLRA